MLFCVWQIIVQGYTVQKWVEIIKFFKISVRGTDVSSVGATRANVDVIYGFLQQNGTTCHTASEIIELMHVQQNIAEEGILMKLFSKADLSLMNTNCQGITEVTFGKFYELGPITCESQAL